MQDPRLIQELKKAFSIGAANGVLDLERFLKVRRSFNILRIEDLYADNGGFVPPYRRSDFLILFVKKGSGQRTIGQYTFTVTDNSLAIIPKYVIHTATYPERPYGYVVSFNPDFFLQQAFPYKLLNSKRVLKLPSGPLWCSPTSRPVKSWLFSKPSLKNATAVLRKKKK